MIGPTTSEQTAKPVSAAAQRMRLTRHRRANGLRCVILEIRDTEIDALIARGLLPRDKRNSKIAISSALYEILDQAFL
jgi:predicted N-formylglutamate amidohydrolase